MKILLVNYYYKPMVDAHAYRWSQLAEYWVKKGHKVDVICSKVEGSGDVDNDSGVNITRVGFRNAIKMQSEGIGHEQGQGIRSLLLHPIKRISRTMYRGVYWPDGLWHWFFAAARELANRRDNKYDVIVSYAPSFSAHLAVLLFKRLSRQKFYWIADYGDPFSTSTSMPHNNATLYKGIDHIVEAKVLEHADKVAFTSKKTLSDYELKFGKRDNCQVIPHLVDLERLYLQEPSSGKDISTIHLVYIGNFHAGIREPFLASEIINALSQHLRDRHGCNIVFDIYGASNGVNITSACNSLIKWHGPLDREKVNDVIHKANFLVNIENTNCSMVPSKIVEYVATGKPIINIAGSDADISDLLRDYQHIGNAIVLRNVASVKTDEAAAFFDNHRHRTSVPRPVVDDFLWEYHIANISERYLNAS